MMELDVLDVLEECARLRNRLTHAERIVEMARVDGAAQSQRRIERLERENNLLREMAYGMSVALRVGDEAASLRDRWALASEIKRLGRLEVSDGL